MNDRHKRALVSVVIPAFNEAAYVAGAIESVLEQTYAPIECIVVNDGSTDQTSEIVGSFGASVQLIDQPHGGPSKARNRGIRAATGTYVAFLDADDLWAKEKLELQMEFLDSRPELAATYTALEIVDRDLGQVGLLPAPPGAHVLRNLMLLEPPYAAGFGSTGLMHTWVFDAIGMFDESMLVVEDHEFLCRIACRFPIDGLDRPLARHRRGHDQDPHPRETQRYVRSIFDKVFDDHTPVALSGLRNRAEANLHLSVAAAYLRQKDYLAFSSHLARALVRRPDRVFAAGRRFAFARRQWKQMAAP
jgi:glycosyltransferase involved in cell wall biosynthesis